MRIVKFLEDKTLRVKKRICLVGIRDDRLVVLHEEWYAETFVRPVDLLSLLFSPWKAIDIADRECGETLKEIERKYGRVKCSIGSLYNIRVGGIARNPDKFTLSAGELSMSGGKIKDALELLLAVLDLREEWKLDKVCGIEK